MALLVSEQMQKRREQKFRRELTRALSVLPAKNLNGFIAGVFDDFDSKPSPDDFVAMTIASKFGTGNAVSEGGSSFLLETCIKVFAEANKSGSFLHCEIQPWGSRHSVMFDKSWSAPIEWSSLNVSAWSVSGLSGRCFRVLVDDIPERCAV